MQEKLKALFYSRRFYGAVGGVLAVYLQDEIGLTPEQADALAGLIMAWIIGDSLAKTERPK